MSEAPENDIFSKIIRGELQCDKVFENEICLAFKDKFPQAPVHVLVIPKKKVLNFSHFIESNTDPLLIGEFFKSVHHIASEVLHLQDYKILTNNGQNAGQEIMYFHVHIKGVKLKSA